MERQARVSHKRAISQLKPSFIEHQDLLSIQKFKPIEYNSKVSINIKMPKVKLDIKIPKKTRQLSESPLRHLVKLVKKPEKVEVIATPQISMKKSSKKFEQPRESIKLIIFPGVEKQKIRMKDCSTQENLPRLNRTKLPKLTRNLNSHGIYFELLGFFIKKHLDYNPVFKKIDLENKGFIDRFDAKNYFYMNSSSYYVDDIVENLFTIAGFVARDSVIVKKTFLGICSAIEYDFPFSYRNFAGENFSKLKIRVLELRELFQEFTVSEFISCEDLDSFCRHLEDHGADKALELVKTEVIDFPRFLVCLPFFMWLKAVIDFKD
jgi:hypothetical protein